VMPGRLNRPQSIVLFVGVVIAVTLALVGFWVTTTDSCARRARISGTCFEWHSGDSGQASLWFFAAGGVLVLTVAALPLARTRRPT